MQETPKLKKNSFSSPKAMSASQTRKRDKTVLNMVILMDSSHTE